MQLRPWRKHLPGGLSVAVVTHLLRSYGPQGTASRESPGGVTLSTTVCVCLGIVRRPCRVCLTSARDFQNFVAWSTPSVKVHRISENIS